MTLKELLQLVPTNHAEIAEWWQQTKTNLTEQANIDIAELLIADTQQNPYLLQHANFAPLLGVMCKDISASSLAKWLLQLADQSIPLTCWLAIIREVNTQVNTVFAETLRWLALIHADKRQALLAKYQDDPPVTPAELEQDKTPSSRNMLRAAAILESPQRLAHLLLDVEFYRQPTTPNINSLLTATEQYPLICDILIHYYHLVGVDRFDSTRHPDFTAELNRQLAIPEKAIPSLRISCLEALERSLNDKKLRPYQLHCLTQKFQAAPSATSTTQHKFNSSSAEADIKQFTPQLSQFIQTSRAQHGRKHPRDYLLADAEWQELLQRTLEEIDGYSAANLGQPQLATLWSQSTFDTPLQALYADLFKTLFNRQYTAALQYFCGIHLPVVAVPAQWTSGDDTEWTALGTAMTINDSHPANLCILPPNRAIDVSWLPNMFDKEGYFINPYTEERLANDDVLTLLQFPATNTVDWQTPWLSKQSTATVEIPAEVLRQWGNQTPGNPFQNWMQNQYLEWTESNKLQLADGAVASLSQPALIRALLLVERLNNIAQQDKLTDTARAALEL